MCRIVCIATKPDQFWQQKHFYSHQLLLLCEYAQPAPKSSTAKQKLPHMHFCHNVYDYAALIFNAGRCYSELFIGFLTYFYIVAKHNMTVCFQYFQLKSKKKHGVSIHSFNSTIAWGWRSFMCIKRGTLLKILLWWRVTTQRNLNLREVSLIWQLHNILSDL